MTEGALLDDDIDEGHDSTSITVCPVDNDARLNSSDDETVIDDGHDSITGCPIDDDDDDDDDDSSFDSSDDEAIIKRKKLALKKMKKRGANYGQRV